MANLGCQLERIWNHLKHRLLEPPVVDFLVIRLLGTRTPTLNMGSAFQ